MEHTLFRCDPIRAGWFASKLGFLSHNILRDEITNWWSSTFELDQFAFVNDGDLKTWLLGGLFARLEMM